MKTKKIMMVLMLTIVVLFSVGNMDRAYANEAVNREYFDIFKILDYYFQWEEDCYFSYDDDYDFKDGGDRAYIENLLSTLIPSDKLERIVEIKEESDGEFGNLAAVEPVDDKGKEWLLVYDPADLNLGKEEIIRTLIHEYAHIESLNETQVRHGDINPNKGEFVISEGVVKEASYLLIFIKKFWTDDMIDKVNSLLDDEGVEIFNSHPNHFVSEYAATNFVEDFAESFAEFVMSDKKTDNTIASQKVNFFYQFKELIELREFMRKGIKRMNNEKDEINGMYSGIYDNNF